MDLEALIAQAAGNPEARRALLFERSGEGKRPSRGAVFGTEELYGIVMPRCRAAAGLPVPEPEEAPAPEEEVPQDDLTAAIEAMDFTDESLWTRGGKPSTKALEAIVGRPVSAGDRDEAWRRVQELRQA